jgi:hypothetical protein
MQTKSLGGNTGSRLLRFHNPQIVESVLRDAVQGKFLHHNRPESEQRPARTVEEALERLKRLVPEYKSYIRDERLKDVYEDYSQLEAFLASTSSEGYLATSDHIRELLRASKRQESTQISDLCTEAQWNLILRLGGTEPRPTKLMAGRIIAFLKKKNGKT